MQSHVLFGQFYFSFLSQPISLCAFFFFFDMYLRLDFEPNSRKCLNSLSEFEPISLIYFVSCGIQMHCCDRCTFYVCVALSLVFFVYLCISFEYIEYRKNRMFIISNGKKPISKLISMDNKLDKMYALKLSIGYE